MDSVLLKKKLAEIEAKLREALNRKDECCQAIPGPRGPPGASGPQGPQGRPGSGGGGGSSVLVNNTAFVDPEYGDDATAGLENQGAPFRTVRAAISSILNPTLNPEPVNQSNPWTVRLSSGFHDASQGIGGTPNVNYAINLPDGINITGNPRGSSAFVGTIRPALRLDQISTNSISDITFINFFPSPSGIIINPQTSFPSLDNRPINIPAIWTDDTNIGTTQISRCNFIMAYTDNTRDPTNVANLFNTANDTIKVNAPIYYSSGTILSDNNIFAVDYRFLGALNAAHRDYLDAIYAGIENTVTPVNNQIDTLLVSGSDSGALISGGPFNLGSGNDGYRQTNSATGMSLAVSVNRKNAETYSNPKFIQSSAFFELRAFNITPPIPGSGIQQAPTIGGFPPSITNVGSPVYGFASLLRVPSRIGQSTNNRVSASMKISNSSYTWGSNAVTFTVPVFNRTGRYDLKFITGMNDSLPPVPVGRTFATSTISIDTTTIDAEYVNEPFTGNSLFTTRYKSFLNLYSASSLLSAGGNINFNGITWGRTPNVPTPFYGYNTVSPNIGTLTQDFTISYIQNQTSARATTHTSGGTGTKSILVRFNNVANTTIVVNGITYELFDLNNNNQLALEDPDTILLNPTLANLAVILPGKLTTTDVTPSINGPDSLPGRKITIRRVDYFEDPADTTAFRTIVIPAASRSTPNQYIDGIENSVDRNSAVVEVFPAPTTNATINRRYGVTLQSFKRTDLPNQTSGTWYLTNILQGPVTQSGGGGGGGTDRRFGFSVGRAGGPLPVIATPAILTNQITFSVASVGTYNRDITDALSIQQHGYYNVAVYLKLTGITATNAGTAGENLDDGLSIRVYRYQSSPGNTLGSLLMQQDASIVRGTLSSGTLTGGVARFSISTNLELDPANGDRLAVIIVPNNGIGITTATISDTPDTRFTSQLIELVNI